MKEIKRRRQVAGGILGMLCLAMLGVSLLRDPSGEKQPESGGAHAVALKKPGTETGTGSRQASGRREVLAAELPEKKSARKMKGILLEEFERLESERTKRLGQRTHETPEGPVEWYLLAIDPPTPAQIAEAREIMARAMEEVEPESRDELDEFMEDEIRIHDLLGTLGKRAAILKVPHDPEGQAVAMTYPTQDYEAELPKLDGMEGGFTLQDAHFRVPSKGQPLDRFAGLREKWKKEEEEGR